jgi:uncharacterized membrane protein
MHEFAARKSRALARLLTTALVITVLDTVYLSWRFIALHAGWVNAGSGLCSWSAHIDCDKVLLTPQARAFYVPNAILGFAFYFGCLVWWVVGTRLGEAYRYYVIRMLAVWLALATLFTFWFIWLLIHLNALCPFCPWNHLLTYIALIAVLRIWRMTPRPVEPVRLKPLRILAFGCVAQFCLWQVLWIVAQKQ